MKEIIINLIIVSCIFSALFVVIKTYFAYFAKEENEVVLEEAPKPKKKAVKAKPAGKPATKTKNAKKTVTPKNKQKKS